MSKQTSRTAVVHLELHTGNLARASAFYHELDGIAPAADGTVWLADGAADRLGDRVLRDLQPAV